MKNVNLLYYIIYRSMLMESKRLEIKGITSGVASSGHSSRAVIIKSNYPFDVVLSLQRSLLANLLIRTFIELQV